MQPPRTVLALPLVAALAWGGVAGCGDPPAPAETSEGPALAALAAGDVDGAIALARALDDATARDLVLAEIARESGRDVCGEIQAPDVRTGCQRTLDRHHLRFEEARAGREAPIATARLEGLPPACAAVAAPLRDSCILGEVDRLGPEAARAACAAVQDADRAGECAVVAVEVALRAGDTDGARQGCADLPEGTWRDDCHFRLSEQLPGLDPAARAGMCGRAGRFEDECVRHIGSDLGLSTVARLEGRNAVDALATIARARDTLQAQVEHPRIDDPTLGAEVEVTALLMLFLQTGAVDSPGPWAALLADPGTDRSVAARGRVMLPMAWARAGSEPGGPAHSLAAWVSAWQDDLGRGGMIPPSLRIDADAPGSMQPPGPLPATLGGEGECARLPLADRDAIAILWGLGPQSWDAARPVLQDALHHPSPAVRHAALMQAGDRLWTWRHDEPAPAWLGEALAAAAPDEANPAVKRLLLAVQESARTGQRPADLPFDGPTVCGGAP